MAATYTTNYNLAQFLAYSVYDAVDEVRRWQAIDYNLGAMAALISDGVVEGWDISYSASSLDISIAAGNGFVNNWAVETEDTTSVTLDANTTTYVVGKNTTDSYYTKEVVFTTLDDPGLVTSVVLALITTDDTGVTAIDTSVKQTCGFSEELKQQLTNILLTHLHDGIDAPKINLSTMVTGLLNSDNIGEIPYSKISGNILASLVGSISHNNLTHIGHWTHPELDTFVDAIATYNYTPMGDIVLANHLQNTITNIYTSGTTAQQSHINERVIIPGKTNGYYEPTYSTAFINAATYQVQGTYAATHTPVAFTAMFDTSTSELSGYLFPSRIGTINNVEAYTTPNTAVYLHRTASAPEYALSGYYIHNEDTNNPLTNWKSLIWTNTTPAGATIWVSYQTKHDTEQWNPAGYLDDTGETTVDLTVLNSAEEIGIKVNFISPTTNITPLLQTMQLTWDNSIDAKYGYQMVNTKENLYNYMTPTLSDINYLNLDDISGAVALQKLKNYPAAGNLISTYLDGTASCIVWDKLYTDTLVPTNTSIIWQARTATDSGYFASYPNNDWTDISLIENSVYDLSPFRYRYLQLQSALTGDTGYTPEILSYYVTRFDSVATNVATSSALHRWTAQTTGNVGFMTEKAEFTNIATIEYIGGLTIADPNVGYGVYKAEPYKPEPSSMWNTIKIYGEGLETENVNINIYLSNNPPAYNYIACSIPTSSPHIVDLTGVSSTFRKDYLWYEITFKD
jgi:hypothetical protein